jgi:hypothetical protein
LQSKLGKFDSQEIAKRLLNHNVSDFAAKKAWYVTKQFNSIGVQEEMILSKIKEDEDFYSVFLKDLPNIKNSLGII